MSKKKIWKFRFLLFILLLVVFLTGAATKVSVQAAMKEVQIDIDKTSAEDFVKKVISYGKKGIKEGNTYDIQLNMKVNSYDEGLKKCLEFEKKVMKAKSNRYGLAMTIGEGYGRALDDI